jgi:hypothetical protein
LRAGRRAERLGRFPRPGRFQATSGKPFEVVAETAASAASLDSPAATDGVRHPALGYAPRLACVTLVSCSRTLWRVIGVCDLRARFDAAAVAAVGTRAAQTGFLLVGELHKRPETPRAIYTLMRRLDFCAWHSNGSRTCALSWRHFSLTEMMRRRRSARTDVFADVTSTATTGHRLRPRSRRRLAWGPRWRSRPLPAIP